MKEMLKLCPNKNGYTHLRVETDYTLGGMNYFSYRNVSRGYYLYVTPITYHVHESGGCSYGTWSTQLGCGLKLLLKAVSRKSKKAESEAETKAKSEMQSLIQQVCDAYGLELEDGATI